MIFFLQSHESVKIFWILGHAGGRIRLLANFGFWIIIITTSIFSLIQDCYAQLKTIKIEDTRISRLKLYEGIEQAVYGYWETASQKFGEALEHNPQNQEAYLCHLVTSDIIDGRLSEYYGENLFRAIDAWIYSNNNKANTILLTLLETKKDYALIYLFKGMNEVMIEDYSKAREDFNKVIELEADINYTYVKRGQLYTRQGQYDLAIEDFNRAIEMDSIYYEAYYERGTVYQTLKVYEKSVNDYEKAFYLYPALKNTLHKSLKICEGYNNLGMVYLKSKNYQEALKNFNNAIDWNPIFHEPYLNRGITYRNLHYFDAAISDFNRVLKLDIAKVEASFNLALTYEEMGKIDETIGYLKKIIEYNPAYSEACQMLGEIFYNQKEFDLATDMFEKLIVIDDKNCWGYYWVALSYDAEKKYKKAIRAYEYFIKIAPDEYYDQKIKMYERAERLKRWIDRDKR